MAKIKGKGFLFEIILPIPENVISLQTIKKDPSREMAFLKVLKGLAPPVVQICRRVVSVKSHIKNKPYRIGMNR